MVQRLRDPDYAALTLRLRNAGDLENAATSCGPITMVQRARGQSTPTFAGKRVTLVSGTNAETDAINDAIQQRQVDQGKLDAGVAAWGMGRSASSSATPSGPATTTGIRASRMVRSGSCAVSATGASFFSSLCG